MTFGTYSGFTVNVVDAKNRLSIPADFRTVIEAKASAREVMLAPHHLGDPCLVGYDRPRLDRLVANLETKYGTDNGRDRERETLMLTGFSSPVGFDESGRLILSADLRDTAGIDRFAAFVGMGDFFQLWNPHTFLEANKDNPMIVRQVTRAMEAKGA